MPNLLSRTLRDRHAAALEAASDCAERGDIHGAAAWTDEAAAVGELAERHGIDLTTATR